MGKLKLFRVCTYVVLLLLSSITTVFAQNRVITGTVNDQTGKGVPGVTVTVKGTKTATQTDANGTYRISAPDNATLVFSSVGYGSTEMPVAGRTDGKSFDATLTATNSNLSEVVVIGYGTARRRDLTGAVSSIQAKDFNQGIIAAPDQLIQNKVPGLEVTVNSGQPGAATTIKIRGNSSIRASQSPLYVVDGVPLDGGSARPNLGTSFGGTPTSNPLLYISPNDVASIEVLKDASSSAIFGSRGANGVVVITTKKGNAGPMKLEANVSFGLNAGFMRRYKILNAGEFRSALTKYGLPATLDGGSSTDAIKEITQNKLTQNYNIALSGGNDLGKFRASFLGSRNEGFLKKSNLDKYIGTFSGQYKFIDKRLTIDFNLITGNYSENLTSVANNSGSQGNIIVSALAWNPTQALRKADGSYNYPSSGTGNPLAFSDAYNDVTSVNNYLANISATVKILNNLDYKFLYGINHSVGERLVNVDGWIQGLNNLSGIGNAYIGQAQLTSQNFTHTLNYRTSFSSSLTFDALVGFEYYKSAYRGSNVFASGFNTNLDYFNRIDIPYTSIFQNAKTQGPLFTFVNPLTEIQSEFARVNLNYNDNLYLTATIRDDGSSKFGKNNRHGYFPSVGAKWAVSNSSFMKGSTLFSNLGLRGSWGITGNQEFPAGSSQEQFGIGAYNTLGQTIVSNPNLKWEATTQYNFGIDYAFAKGRVFGSIDYYNKNTKDILFQTNSIQPAPNATYFINLPANLVNAGVEFALGATIVQNKKITWDANFNLAYNHNEIKNFLDVNTKLPLKIQTGTIDGQGVSGTLAQIITNGKPVNEYYLKPFGGFDQSGNQIIGNDPVFAGDPNPHVIAGFSTSLRYEKFTFSMNMGGSFGFLIYNNTATSVTNIAGIVAGRNIDVSAYNSGEKTGSGVGASTRFLEKGDYAKLRNATIRYSAGDVGKYIKGLSAFISGSNLFVITKFSGFDPEVNIDKSNGAYPSRSIEYVPYPTPRVITFGFSFSL